MPRQHDQARLAKGLLRPVVTPWTVERAASLIPSDTGEIDEGGTLWKRVANGPIDFTQRGDIAMDAAELESGGPREFAIETHLNQAPTRTLCNQLPGELPRFEFVSSTLHWARFARPEQSPVPGNEKPDIRRRGLITRHQLLNDVVEFALANLERDSAPPGFCGQYGDQPCGGALSEDPQMQGLATPALGAVLISLLQTAGDESSSPFHRLGIQFAAT